MCCFKLLLNIDEKSLIFNQLFLSCWMFIFVYNSQLSMRKSFFTLILLNFSLFFSHFSLHFRCLKRYLKDKCFVITIVTVFIVVIMNNKKMFYTIFMTKFHHIFFDKDIFSILNLKQTNFGIQMQIYFKWQWNMSWAAHCKNWS